MKEAAKIRPLDADGKESADGKIGLISVGMSNTTQEDSRFMQLANADAAKSAKVVLIDGAQGGQTGRRWADAKDLSDKDGTHPSGSGQTKVAELLLKFLKTDATAQGWFTGKASAAGGQ